VPEFAVVGHPNEGKSSVLSTLAEDDSVRISPVPGETRECRRFPVRVDGR
jgi:ribosome biogenesis GTPase A